MQIFSRSLDFLSFLFLLSFLSVDLLLVNCLSFLSLLLLLVPYCLDPLLLVFIPRIKHYRLQIMFTSYIAVKVLVIILSIIIIVIIVIISIIVIIIIVILLIIVVKSIYILLFVLWLYHFIIMHLLMHFLLFILRVEKDDIWFWMYPILISVFML